MSAFVSKKKTIKDSSRFESKTVKKSTKRHVSIRDKVEIRQSSAKDEQGDTIPNTAICTDHEHCPFLKMLFFKTLEDIDENNVRDNLKAAFTGDRSILERAIWVISYLEDKKKYLKNHPTHSVSLGPNGLQFQHIFIIEDIIDILENILSEEEKKEKPSSRCPEVGCTISYRNSTKLIF